MRAPLRPGVSPAPRRLSRYLHSLGGGPDVTACSRNRPEGAGTASRRRNGAGRGGAATASAPGGPGGDGRSGL